MKKILVYLLTAAILLSIGSISAFAANNDAVRAYSRRNNDGVCDNFGSNCGNGQGAGFVDADNDGICDNFGSNCGNGQGSGFVDADNDGVCDNFGSNCGNGQARGHYGGRRN